MWACSLYALVYLFGPIFHVSFHFTFSAMFLLFLFGNCRHGCSDICTFHWKMNDEFEIVVHGGRLVNYLYVCSTCTSFFLFISLLLFTLSCHSHKCLLLMGLFWYYSYLAHKLIHWHIAIFTCETDSLMCVECRWLNGIESNSDHKKACKHLVLCACEIFVCESRRANIVHSLG